MSGLGRGKQRQSAAAVLSLSGAQSESDVFVTCTCILKNFDLKLEKSVRECVCDRGGGCAWTGDAGSCTADLGGLNNLFENFNLDNSLLHRKKCKKLPEAKRGKWVCDEESGSCQLT